jgi:hypothetical protein
MMDMGGSGEQLKFFSKEDIIELLVDEGFDEGNCFI